MEDRRNYQAELDQVQTNIEDINTRILLLQMQRERYEQIGHQLVAAMMGDKR
jgi:hemoglobin-like flavoprotein